MFTLFKNSKAKKTVPRGCVHQRATATAHEPSTEPQALTSTEQAAGLEPGHIAIEKHPGQVSEELPVPQCIPASNGPCLTCKEEKREARKYRWILVAGLFFPFTVQALDATIIAGALPFIASDFQELAQLNWIVTAFNLTSAAFIPAWGQFADIFGRHASLQVALVLMLIGSAFCAGAPTTAFPMLLVGRALQGISCAGLNILTRVILADKVSLKENAKNNTIFAIVGGLGYGVGPVIGGYLTQASWRWCFIINLPCAAIGIVLAFFLLRPHLLGPHNTFADNDMAQSRDGAVLKARLSSIDYGGQILFLFGMGLLVLALTWGGSYYAWSDVKVLAPLAIGCVILSAFLIWEYLKMPGRKLALAFPRQMAMVPINLIWTRNAGLLLYINFVTGMALFAVFYFVDIYFALVLGYPPGKAGTQLLYYTPGLGVGTYLAMFCCNIYPRQTWFPLAFGTLIEPLGITLLAVAINWDNVPVINGMLALSGVGTGIRFMPGSLHGVGYFPNQIASIISLVSLAIALGGTFSITLMFTVFNNHLSNAGITLKSGSSNSFDQISTLSPDSQANLRNQVRSAISLSFFALCSFLWLGLIAVAFMGNVKITREGKGLEGEGVRDFSENIVEGSYIGSLLKKRNGVVKRTNVRSGAQEPDAEKGRNP